MGEYTNIEWADSTSNGEMGCDGCELAQKDGSVPDRCYAKVLTDRRSAGKGNKGWPKDFFSPQIFPGRFEKACRWPDLTGSDRPDKPWLNGLPRHIFPDDLGDTWTESLPLDWIAPHIPAMAASPHVWLFLTKRPDRMFAFFRAYGSVPKNFLLGTSCIASTARVRQLAKLKERFPEARVWVSAEPLWTRLDFRPWIDVLSWIVPGGESGPEAGPTQLAHIREILDLCREFGKPAFLKQLGAWISGAPMYSAKEGWTRPSGFSPNRYLYPDGRRFTPPVLGDVFNHAPAGWTAFSLYNAKGGDWSEWPEDLRVREMPGGVRL